MTASTWECLARAYVRTLAIQKASPWDSGYVESLNGGLRHELLDPWRMDPIHVKPHSGLTWMTPAALVAGLDVATDADMLAWENSGFSIDASARIEVRVPGKHGSADHKSPISRDMPAEGH